MKRSLTLSVVVALVFATIASAAVKEGDTEISFSGTWTQTNMTNEAGGGSADSTLAVFSLGKFVTNELELSVTSLGMWSSSSGGNDSSTYGIGGSAKYHFMTQSTAVPYIGLQGLYATNRANGDTSDGIVWGPLAGFKFFVSESTSLFIEYQYQIYGGDIGNSIEDGHAILAGISFKW
jgi:hypothetical protein